jgi:rRNA small subunit pseudouridine methyltransferase Nep1
VHLPVAWILLFESNIETIPPDIAGDRSLVKLAKNNKGRRPEQIILDRAVHHFALQHLSDGLARGRPDIAHMSILSVTDTPAYASGAVKLLIHTVGNRLIEPAYKWRPPRNYRNFLGLMEALMEAGRVPPSGKPILKLQTGSIEDAVSRTKAEHVVLLSSHGRLCDLREKVESLKGRSVTYLVGAYAKGEPRADVVSVADEVVSIHPSPLSSSVVVARLLYEIERTTGHL